MTRTHDTLWLRIVAGTPLSDTAVMSVPSPSSDASSVTGVRGCSVATDGTTLYTGVGTFQRRARAMRSVP
jgi:hypothetical protein